MRILVLSDTHVPSACDDLPDVIYQEIKNVDMIIHAGDFVDIRLLKKLKSLKPLEAVYGNMDSGEIREKLPKTKVISVGGFNIAVVHSDGYKNSSEHLKNTYFKNEKIDVVIFGHTHRAQNFTDKNSGVLYFNPGSPTDKIFSPYNSYGIIDITKKITADIVKII